MPFLALLPLALQLFPTIGRWLGGATGETVASSIGQVVATVTGASTPEEAQAALADPAKRAELILALAQLNNAHELAMRQADDADRASARDQTAKLAAAGSPIAWGAPIVSFIVLLSFGLLAISVMMQKIPEGSETLAAGLLETVKILSVTVIGYWCGSSAGSARKDAVIGSVASQGGGPTLPLPSAQGPSR